MLTEQRLHAAEGGGRDGNADPLKILNAVGTGIGDVDSISLGRYGDAYRPVELAVARAVRAPLAEGRARGGEVLEAVIAGVGNEDVAVGRDGNTGRVLELAVAGAPRAPLRERVLWERPALRPYFSRRTTSPAEAGALRVRGSKTAR